MSLSLPSAKARKKSSKYICKVNLSSKVVGVINLKALLNNLELISFLKELPHDFVNSACVYNLNNL